MRSLRFLVVFPVLVGGWLAPAGAAPERGTPEAAEAKPIDVIVADFDARDPDIAKAITQTVFTDLSRSKRVKLHERSELAKVLKEQKIEASGLVNPETASKIGELIGVRKMVIGGFTQVGKRVSLYARLVDVETAAVETGHATQVEGGGGNDEPDIYGLAHTLADQVHYAILNEWLPQSQQPASPGNGGEVKPRIGLEVKLDRPEGSTWYWNETMKVSFRVDQPCYVYVYNIDTSRAVSQLYPNEYLPERRADANRWYQVPPEDAMGWELGIEGETGPEEIVVLASEQPLDAGQAKFGDLLSHNAATWRGRQVVARLRTNPGSITEQRVRFYTTKVRP